MFSGFSWHSFVCFWLRLTNFFEKKRQFVLLRIHELFLGETNWSITTKFYKCWSLAPWKSLQNIGAFFFHVWTSTCFFLAQHLPGPKTTLITSLTVFCLSSEMYIASTHIKRNEFVFFREKVAHLSCRRSLRLLVTTSVKKLSKVSAVSKYPRSQFVQKGHIPIKVFIATSISTIKVE